MEKNIRVWGRVEGRITAAQRLRGAYATILLTQDDRDRWKKRYVKLKKEVDRGAASEERQFVWQCEVCGKPIKDGQGYIDCVPDEPLPENLGSRMKVGEDGKLVEVPFSPRERERRRWAPLHQRCDPRFDLFSFYWIDVERCRYYWQLLDWSAHLMEKSWLEQTDWNEFLRKAVRGYRGRGESA